MPAEVKRGYVPTDSAEFSAKALPTLRRAQEELVFLLDRGCEIQKAVTFIGNHYQLSARQRLALTRVSSSTEDLRLRRGKQWEGSLEGAVLRIDAFNLIITLEAALSGSTLLYGMDGTVRDLCGLHGTYRLIDKTDRAIGILADAFKAHRIDQAIFYLDAPVSNSARLKVRILEVMNAHGIKAEAHLVNNADAMLWEQENVVTSDAIILNRCISWTNLGAEILRKNMPDAVLTDLSAGKAAENENRKERGKRAMFESPFCKVEFCEEEQAVRIAWKQFCCGEDYREPVRHALRLLREHSGAPLLIDARNGFEDEKADVEWGFAEFLPKLPGAGCRRVVFLMNEVNEIEEEMDLWGKEFQKYVTVSRAASYPTAAALLREKAESCRL